MRIALLGAGKMGAWLAGQLAGEHELAVYDREPERARAVAGAQELDRLEALPGFGPELLINAVSLVNTVEVFEQAAAYLPPTCVLADLASMKGEIPAYYGRCGFKFASVHPMFGPTFAKLEALRDENAIIIRESEPATAQLFRALFERLGLAIFEYSFAEHDQMMAYSLTTPFACSMAFAACIHQRVVPGTTFAKHLAIARGLLAEDDELLIHILFNPHSAKQLSELASHLWHLRATVDARNPEEARRLLAKLRRNLT